MVIIVNGFDFSTEIFFEYQTYIPRKLIVCVKKCFQYYSMCGLRIETHNNIIKPLRLYFFF